MRPELPDYGAFLRWPGDGSAWIYPDDRAIVMRMIPGERVFRRHRFDGNYYHYQYGETRFRLQPCMWLPIPGEGVDIGDLVETIGFALERELFVGTVLEALFVEGEGRVLYRIDNGGAIEDRLYSREEFKVLTNKLSLRVSGNEHPTPLWVTRYQDESISGPRLPMGDIETEVEADDGSDQQANRSD